MSQVIDSNMPNKSASSHELGLQSLPTRAYRVERLEPRIMLSADPIGVAESALDLLVQQSVTDTTPVDLDTFIDDFSQSQHLAANDDSLTLDSNALDNLFDSSPDDLLYASVLSNDAANVEIIIIDAAVDNQAELLDQIVINDSGTVYDIYYLNATEDGLAQITSILANQENIDAIHLLSHGNSTGLQLGNSWVSQESLIAHADVITQWSTAVSGDADMLIYGCDLLSTEEGVAFAELLQQLSNMDVAASDDATGAASLGGNWNLERTFGAVEAVSLQLNDDWSSTLAAPATGLLIASNVDVEDSDVDNLEGWKAGDILSISDPTLTLGTATNATVSIYASLSELADDGDVTITGLHYVTSYVTVGTDINGDPYTLMPGDLLFAVSDNEDFDGVHINKKDVALFRPDSPGDYTSGIASVFLDNLTTKDMYDFALVESSLTVAGQTLNAGDLVFNDKDDTTGDIQVLTIETVGNGNTTSSNGSTLVTGVALGSNNSAVRGLEVIQQDITLGGHTFVAGELLFSFEEDQTALLGLVTEIYASDIYAISTDGTTAALVFDGSDIGFSNEDESPDAIALVPFNNAPMGTPAVDGVALEGQTLIANTSGLSDADGISSDLAYQWQISSDGSSGWFDISGSANESFDIGEEHANQYVRVAVTYIDQRGQAEGPIYSDATAQIQAFNDAPVVSITPRNPAFVEGDAPSLLFTGASVDLGESFDSVIAFSVSISNVLEIGEEFLGFDGGAISLANGSAGSTSTGDFSYNVSFIGDTANISFTTAGASASEFEALLNQMTYQNLSADPTEVTKTLTLESLQDSGGTNNGGVDTVSPGITSTITLTATNQAPTSTPVTLTSIEEDTPRVVTQEQLIANASDTESSLLVASGLTITAGNGTLQDSGEGTWLYTPDLNDIGTIEFSYNISDGSNNVAETASLEITSVNDTPESTHVTLSSINEDTGLFFTQDQLLANATDVDGDVLTVTGLTIDSSDGGDVYGPVFSVYYFETAENYNGIVSFTYQISDGSKTVTATASLVVNAVNDEPESSPVSLLPIDEDNGGRTITQAELLANATDVENDSLAANGLTITSGNGSLVDNGDGTWSYTSPENNNGTTTFSYSITDGTDSIAAMASLVIDAVNDTPVSSPVFLSSIDEDSGTRIITQAELLINTSDADDDGLTVNGLTITSGNGSLVDNGDGTWSYTSPENNNGTTTFSYSITDGTDSIAAMASLVIDAVNDTPVSSPVFLSPIDEDSGARIITQAELLINTSDADDDGLTVNGLTITSGNGSLVDNGDGTWSYTSPENNNGTTTFSYSITDGTDSIAAMASLVIDAVNDTPVSSPVFLSPIDEDSGARIITQAELLINASDADSAGLTVKGLTIASGDGRLVDNGDGSWSYVPADNDSGTIVER